MLAIKKSIPAYNFIANINKGNDDKGGHNYNQFFPFFSHVQNVIMSVTINSFLAHFKLHKMIVSSKHVITIGRKSSVIVRPTCYVFFL